MGGDLPLQLTLEGLLRLLPGVVGKRESVIRDSFSGPWVDAPAYTAPVVWKGREVPAVVRSGDHKRIEQWEEEIAITATVRDHFSWLRSHQVTDRERGLVRKQIPPHYVALMHDEIRLPHGFVGTTSVTSIDIHDIARSSRTYGMAGFFIVTPLLDQKKIVQKLLNFWRSESAHDYNQDRYAALERTHLVDRYQDVIEKITNLHGKPPLVLVTSARSTETTPLEPLSYHDQGRVWGQERPVLILLGTGHGLSDELCARADYRLLPVEGYSDFNHLSVRSAAAIIFDRWLGINAKLPATSA
jgi:tRNA (guanine37-N1)-methyltransferase